MNTHPCALHDHRQPRVGRLFSLGRHSNVGRYSNVGRHSNAAFCLAATLCLQLSNSDQATAQQPSDDKPGPVKVSFRELAETSDPNIPSFLGPPSKRPTQESPKRFTQLGARDDSRAIDYHVPGRGVETPTGKKSGRYSQDGMARAGFPWIPNSFATIGITPSHSVGIVGGSTPFESPLSGPLQGESRTRTEGVFGKDYSGWIFKRKTWLAWTHGSREQGGSGRYETDGPKLLPE